MAKIYATKNSEISAREIRNMNRCRSIAAEGMVATAVSEDQKCAVVVEVNSETDFVAKNEKFQNYVAEVAAQLLNSDAADMDAFLEEKWALDASMTVKEKLSSMISVIGENMNIRRCERMCVEEGLIASYIHAGGKIGVLVKVESDCADGEILEMGRNVAMQCAALKPKFCTSKEVPADFLEKETEILKAQIENDPKEAAKPEKVKMGMIQGRINKELKEICLVDQVYVKAEDGKQTVSQYVQSVAKAKGCKAAVTAFLRFETGEGLQKREEDFAAEVAKQMGN